MGAFARRVREVRRTADSGIAIVAAMAVVMLVGVMVTVTIGLAINSAKDTGRDRERSSAVSTAEGQADIVEAQIQSSPPATLASTLCGTLPGSATVGSDSFGITTTVTYYKADGTAIDCTQLATTQAAQAKIVAKATGESIEGTAPAARTVETLLRLTPTYAAGLDKAIFSNSTMYLANQGVLTSASGKPDADIYTNGDFYCRSSGEQFSGSIYAQGLISLESNCKITVDAWAKGNVNVTNDGTAIGGRALSANGNVTLGGATIGQQARAKGTATGSNCPAGVKCFSGQIVDAPPVTAFPKLTWDATAQAGWTAAGYTNVVTIPDSTGQFTCSWYQGLNNNSNLTGADGTVVNFNGKGTGPAAWLFANGYKLPAPTILLVNCPNDKVTFQGPPLVINKNVLIVARAGITMSSGTIISAFPGSATAANPNLLYLVQPSSYNGTTTTCSGDGIALDSSVTVQNTVNTLLYSPCDIRKANQANIVGQVYSGGEVHVDNQFQMTYIPMPVWGGLAGAGSAVKSYSLDVLYVRETA